MFYFDDFYGKKILNSTLLKDFDCFFTTRNFVLTPANRIDLNEISEKNRIFLKEKLNCKEITTAKQTHSDHIKIVETNKYFYDDTDALISNKENSLLLMNFADCVPIILYSPKDNTGAIVHAGWRGTANKILKKTIIKMRDELNIHPQNITALIGPSIGECCFETDYDVFKELIDNPENKNLYKEKNSKYYIDLKELNNIQLKELGVENIDICSYCTCCMSDIFFSYRKEKGITARHSAIIKIKGDKICQ
jgi:YfiH family protein